MRVQEGPGLLFVTIWGLFAVVMVDAHAQMAAHGAKIAMPVQYEDPEQPTLMAALD